MPLHPKLLQAADFNIERAERGIIYVDEVDRLLRKAKCLYHTWCFEGVQQALLKIIGNRASVPPQGGRKHPQQRWFQVDTKNILFIVGGAIASKKLSNNVWVKKVIGFGQNNKAIDENSSYIQKSSQRYSKIGIIPELIGRLQSLQLLSN